MSRESGSFSRHIAVIPAQAGIRLASKMQYYVYIMIDHPLGLPYIGMTNDLVRRVYEHKNHLAKGSYTDKYNQDKLVYYEIYDNPEQAILREKRLKKWNHNWKMRLIIDQNPHWKDLYEEILQ